MTDGVRAALSAATRRLATVSGTPRLDAEVLMAHALGIEREKLLLDVTAYFVPNSFAALIDRRAKAEPIGYIAGYKDFWTIRLAVGPGALIPRPDSETLIEAAVAHFGDTGPATILDLGTGPGTLLLAALDQWPRARGIGIDASARALSYASANAETLGMAHRATFILGSWADAMEVSAWRAELILCNPPYVGTAETLDPTVFDFEPQEALFAGADGLDDYRVIIPRLASLLAPGGIAILEIGSTQRDAVSALARLHGFAVTCHNDLAGRNRALVCRAS